MKGVGLTTNVPATKGSAELNHHSRDELKEVRNGVGLDGHGLSEEDESRINEEGNGGAQLLRQHQKAQGSVVQWEQFLPLRSLKVLLVENDDSTRHVVSALLRNCSYEVMAVANGLEAWKVLIDRNKQIDLVLTEVVMPYLSGIGLLSKIMNHVPIKNIPVIMMSSDDSMGIVFNCLSKGAVDFLVKPIRKNELKNLWQHVWRKCHSSSGSGSESGIRTLKSTKLRSIEGSDDVSNSSEEDDDVSIGLTAKGGSDKGSGTQSSWSKRAIEVDSSQVKSWDKLPEPHDTISAEATHAWPKASNDYGPANTTTREHRSKDEKLGNTSTGLNIKKKAVAMGKDLEIGVPTSSCFKIEDGNKKKKGKFCESNPKKVVDKLDIGRLQLGNENSEPKPEAANVMLAAAKTSNHTENVTKTNDLLKNINMNSEPICYMKESPGLDLSLKRSRDVEDPKADTQERNVLRHSDLSAFARYNTISNVNQAPTGNVGSCSPLGVSSEAAKPENKQSNSNGTPNQRSNGNSNNDDMGSTTNNVFTKPEAVENDKMLPKTSTIVFHSAATTLQPLIPCNVDSETVKTVLTQPQAVQQQVQIRHHHHHYHHHHHHVHKQQMANHDDESLQNMGSNVLTVSPEGNAANYGSASGSNNKSNGENGNSGQKGSSSAAVAEAGKTGGDNVVTEKCKTGDGSGSGSGVDQERLTQREAALNKFRQKRKERCFEKKVRYQSRKRLAEQRPRVHGQFVRQGANANSNKDADS